MDWDDISSAFGLPATKTPAPATKTGQRTEEGSNQKTSSATATTNADVDARPVAKPIAKAVLMPKPGDKPAGSRAEIIPEPAKHVPEEKAGSGDDLKDEAANTEAGDEETEETEQKSEEDTKTESKKAQTGKKGKKGRMTDKQRKALEKKEKEKARQDEIRAKHKEESLDTEVTENTWAMNTGLSKEVHMGDVFLTVEGRDLLEAARLRLQEGHRYGLVGRNGVGKTTLLRRIATGKLANFPQHLRCLHVKQEVVGDDKTALEHVMAADTERIALLKEEKELLGKLEGAKDSTETNTASASKTKPTSATSFVAATTTSEKKSTTSGATASDAKSAEATAKPETSAKDPSAVSGDRLSEVYARLNQIDAHTAEKRAIQILTGLQFSKIKMGLSTSKLSGGWRMRVALACALFMQPDILLLDEPTNHLDLEAVLWLEHYLSNVYEGTCIIVSHDRAFLDNVSTDIIHFHRKQLTYYTGNFSAFEKSREEKLHKMQSLQESLDMHRKHIKDSIETIQKKAANTKKGADDKRLKTVSSRKHKLARMGIEKTENGRKWNCQSHGRRLGSINDNAGGWKDGEMSAGAFVEGKEKELKFDFQAGDSLGVHGPVLQFAKMGFRFPESKKNLLSDVTLDITTKSRIAILGKNGAGKSTLLNLIMGTLKNTQGSEYRHHNLRLSFFTQHHVDSLDMGLTGLQHMTNAFPGKKEFELRAQLGRFGITGPLAIQPIATLSGGQKTRVVLATVTYSKPHILLLDEPTNHLDFDSIKALTQALNDFEGGVVLVSHDQALITGVAKELWEVTNGRVVQLHGSFADYKATAMAALDTGDS